MNDFLLVFRVPLAIDVINVEKQMRQFMNEFFVIKTSTNVGNERSA